MGLYVLVLNGNNLQFLEFVKGKSIHLVNLSFELMVVCILIFTHISSYIDTINKETNASH